jgi:hypothetical protein
MKIALRALHGCSVDRKHFRVASVDCGFCREEIERGESTQTTLCVQLVCGGNVEGIARDEVRRWI